MTNPHTPTPSNSVVTDLEPCPFCGGNELAMPTHAVLRWVECKNAECGTEGPALPTRGEAIEAWNTRALAMQSANTTGSDELVGIRRALRDELLDAEEEGEATVRVRCDHLRYALNAIATPSPAGSDELVERLAEVIAPHLRSSYFNPDTDDQAEARDFAISIARKALSAIATPDTDRVAVLTEAVAKCRDFLRSAPLESGVCCCGNPVDGHGYGDGHSPIDELQYHASNLAEELDAALSQPLSSKGGVL